ncbi:MAG: 6-pyruvoyl-tetrahydropterin synthase-related protein, partial [Anaerovoracaceae bacterium]
MGKKERPIAIGKPADNIIPEFLLAILIAGGVSLAAFSNLLFMEEGLYNVTADGMGHLTKVVYLAESWKNLEFPSWCPFWYNGSTITQYYAPLGYWMMAIAQIFTGDVMLTMKIYCFVSLFFGSLGVWVICRKYIGNWCGLFAVFLYGTQPYLLRTFFAPLGGGMLAQGVVFLITPWLLVAVLNIFQHHTKKSFGSATILVALLILGHAMHAFMICLWILLMSFPYVLLRKISSISFFLVVSAMGLGAILCSFWWFV